MLFALASLHEKWFNTDFVMYDSISKINWVNGEMKSPMKVIQQVNKDLQEYDCQQVLEQDGQAW